MFQLQRRKGLEENTPTSSTDYRPETPKTSRRLPPQGDGVSKRHKMDETDRPGRTLDKDVDENPTENPSAEYHQNACRRVSVDDNVHEQSTEIEDELERSGKYRVIYGNGNRMMLRFTVVDFGWRERNLAGRQRAGALLPCLVLVLTDLTVSYDSHI